MSKANTMTKQLAAMSEIVLSLILVLVSSSSLRAANAAGGGMTLENFSDASNWKVWTADMLGTAKLTKLDAGPVKEGGAVSLEVPGMVYRILNEAEIPAGATEATGLAFWVKGDGSDNYGCIGLAGATPAPAMPNGVNAVVAAYTRATEYVHYFPLKDGNWHQVKVGWSDFKAERNDRRTANMPAGSAGYGTTINSEEGLKSAGIRSIRLGSRFNMTHRFQGPVTYAVGPMEFVTGAIPPAAKKQAYVFKHPGLMLGKEDLELIKSEVDNTDANPSESVRLRKLGWEEMMKTPAIIIPDDGKRRSDGKKFLLSDLEYPPHAKEQLVGDGGISENMSTDAWAAYCHALQWYVKGNQANADKAIEILNAWSSQLKSVKGVWPGQERLAMGWITQRLCEAAEILRYSNSGWKEADIQRFETMLKTILLPQIDRHWSGNWECSFINSMVAMGVFCNDEDIFNLGINFYHGTGDATPALYILPSGQNHEIMRDFGHAHMGIGEMADTCEIAWHQGLDLYGDLPDLETGLPRLAKAFEYIATIQSGKYVTAVYDYGVNKSTHPRPEGETATEVQITGVDGKNWSASPENGYAKMIQPIYEVAWNHYANRMGLGAKMPNVQELLNSQNVWWLERATPGKAYRPEEKRNTGMYGWGTLTHSNLGKPDQSKPKKPASTAK